MPFIDSFQEKIWEDKYQYKDETYEGFCERIAYTIFPAEKEKAFQLKESIMGFRTLFGGRINSNIGIDEKGLTLFNCFIEATVKNPDSLEGIFDAVAKYGLTLKSEGGVGFCANYLRPANTLIRKVGVTTPGVTKFLEIFDKVSEVITSGSVIKEDSFQGEPTKKSIRKGATMVTLSCCHPDIEEFITAKSVPNKLTKMNMSVLITDAFMYAVDNDLDWDLWFPDISYEKYDDEWDGDFEKWAGKGYPTIVYKTIKANYLWEVLLKSSYCVPGALQVPAYINNKFVKLTIEKLHSHVENKDLVHVLSINNKTLKVEKKVVTNSMYSGKKETLNIITSSNLVYTCTDEHRLFGVEEKRLLSEKRAKAFNVGDFIARTTVTNIETEESLIDSDWEIFVGLLIGDGSVRHGNTRIAVHSNQLDEVLPLANRIAGRYSRKVKLVYDKRSENWVEININSVKLSSVLEKLMYKDKFIGQKTSIKMIPTYLFTTLNLESVRNFISGYFSADGCINGQKTTFYSKHEFLVTGIQRLLLRLGIISRKYKVIHKKLKVSGFRVDINFINMLVLLKEIPEFLIESKIKRFVPKNKYKAPIRLMPHNETKSFSGKSRLFKKNGTTGRNNFPEEYKNLFDGDIRYEKIVAISKNDVIATYDLTVEGNENFICVDGGLYHNCRNEPGLLFIDTIRKMDNLHYLDSSILATNPCQPSWATVLTKKGIDQFKDIDIGSTIWSEDGWVEVLNKQSSGIKDVYKYRTNAGVFYGTKDHKVASKGKKVKIKDAVSIDALLPPTDIDFDLTSKKYLDDLICGDIENTKIISNVFVSTEEVFDITVSGKSHTYWTGGCNVFNCGEVIGNTGVVEHKGKTYELGDICNLGSLVLPYYYNMNTKVFNKELFVKDIELMVEALDNIIDISDYPLEMYELAAKMKRKIGLGLAGVGSLFMMMNIKYGGLESSKVMEDILSIFMNSAYQKSAMLAKEKGSFELYSEELLRDGYVKNSGVLTTQTIDLIKKYGLRHSAISAIAPNGTLAILAGNVSGGLEPVFSPEYTRWNRVEGKKVDFDYPNIHKGEWFETDYLKEELVADEVILMATDNKYRVDKNQGLCIKQIIRDFGYNLAKKAGNTEFVSASELTVQEHFNVLSVFAKYTDLSCSKTINLPADIAFEDFKALYGKIHKQGIKGCTTYREGTSVAILETKKEEKDQVIKKQQKDFLDAFKDHENGNIIRDVIKLPEEFPSKGYILRAENKKWYVNVAFKNEQMTKPFGLFVNTNDPSPTLITNSAIEALTKAARKHRLGGKKLEDVERKFSRQQNSVKIARMLGYLLRHNMPIIDIVSALDGVEDAHVGTFVFRIKKFLMQFITEPVNLGTICPECGSKDVVLQEGCSLCRGCGSSACS